MNKENVVIIGSGPAALTAAIYLARAAMKPLIVEGSSPGGQLMGTTFIENWPGDKKILGVELMMNMRDHAESLGTRFLATEIIGVQFDQKPFNLTTKKNEKIITDSVIIATGATPKRLGCKGEDDYWGKGVTTCAVCDGPMYNNKPVIIVGGGDTAMEDASFMTKYTDDITIVHILDALTASHAMQERVINNPNIKIIYESTVTEIVGNNGHVRGALITNQKTKEVQTLETAAVFVAIGLTPNTGIFKGQLELDRYGYINLQTHTKTSIPGVFAAGDVADYRYRQAITSAGTGCMAALDAERYLKEI